VELALDEAFNGCYEAPRAAALAGVPVSTVYHWARTELVVPSISHSRVKLWSYADLMALRIGYWLRHPVEGEKRLKASPMSQVRQAFERLSDLGLDLWTSEAGTDVSPIWVTQAGEVVLNLPPFSDLGGQLQLGDNLHLNLLGPFDSGPHTRGPDLRRPRSHLRIVPGKVAGEPHVSHSRLTTPTIAALKTRGFTQHQIEDLYPEADSRAITQAIDLEIQLTANLAKVA
jgi:uncharacterized protein (DUF433 family)